MLPLAFMKCLGREIISLKSIFIACRLVNVLTLLPSVSSSKSCPKSL